MKKKPELSPQTIKQNLQKLREFLAQHKIDGAYVSSNDIHLNEYVPLADCHRFYFTGFTGSTAEVLIPTSGRAKLYVDGRYHQQADLEVDHELIEVVKCDAALSLTQSLLDSIKELGLKRIALEAERTSWAFLKRLEKIIETVPFYNQEMAQLLTKLPLGDVPEIKGVAREYRGRDTQDKLREIFSDERQGMFLAALDQISWLTNCRGYHLPHLSSFRAKALATREKIFVFTSPETPIDHSAHQNSGVEWIAVKPSQFKEALMSLQNRLHLNTVSFDPSLMNSSDVNLLLSMYRPENLRESTGGVIPWMSIKEPLEIRQMEESFKRSDRAIFQTIQWLRQQLSDGKRVTELDLYLETSRQYQAQGAAEQSFNTIAGVGPNGAIIHYGSPSDQVVIGADDMILLDSGGYFEGGFATDTTRTFLASTNGKPRAEFKRIYTLVLKGVLALQNAVFLEGTKGNVLDGMARAPMLKYGHNYAHGTGHGVGIHVHEDGVRISTASNVPMRAGQVVSIEPGIYLPGVAGVRLENVALVEKHPEFPGYLRFRSFTNIGFDPLLVDENLLNSEEKQQLEDYEAVCLKRGTSFRLSPLTKPREQKA